MEYPEIMSKNYVNVDDVFSLSSGSSASLYDWNRDTNWLSVGSNDGVNETIEITFYEGSDTINRTIDRFIVLDTNIKDFYLEYYDGSWHTIAATDLDANADSNIYISFASVTASKVRFNMLKTITPNEDKYISELIIALSTYQLVDLLSTRKRNDISQEISLRLGTGMLKKERFYSKYAQDISLEFTSKTQRNSLKDIYNANDPFIFIWSADDLDDDEGGIYYVIWEGGWEQEQVYKGSHITYEITMRLREV